MAICGRCFLCNRKYECVKGRHCDDCADGPDEAPIPIGDDGWKICRSCYLLLGTTHIGGVIESIMCFAHAKNGEST